jgi:hypothetical protein
MPLIVLTAGEMQTPPDATAVEKANNALLMAEWRRAHDELAALSTRGVKRLVPDSSHDIQDMKRQLVINAIDEVVDEVRTSADQQPAR